MAIAMVVPTGQLSDLYGAMRDVANDQAEKLGLDATFNQEDYFLMLQYCYNTWFTQDDPKVLPDDLPETLERILEDFSILNVDQFLEETALIFPSGTQRIDYLGIKGFNTFWRLTYDPTFSAINSLL